ncbi:MAG: DUF1566 domain-containing protein [Flavobacteriales bacterium]|nr:DUF1566 domain-containing protein [Flavobacteriales bacterium]
MSWNTNDNVDPIFQDWGEAYKELCELIKAKVPEIKHVDLYYGQDQVIDSDGKWLPFRAPAVFLDFQAAQVNDVGDLAQQLEMDVTVWVATETVQDTTHGSAGQRRAMQFVGLMRKLHVALHNASGEHYSPLSRVGMQRKADAPPYMYMYGQTYRCIIHDNSTSPQLQYLMPPHQLEIEPVTGEVPPITPAPGECPTVQQLIPITTVQVIAQSLTTQQAADLYILLGGNAGDLETLVGEATPQQLYAVMTPDQVNYVQSLLPAVEIRNSAGALLGTVQGGAPPYVCPDAVTRTTTGATIVQVTPAGESENLPLSNNRYINAAGYTAATAPSNTEYGGGLLRPAYVIPRFTLLKADGVTPHAYRDITNPFYTLPEEGDPIIYNFGRHLHAGPAASSVLGDDPWLLQQGWYDLTQTVGYLSKHQYLVDEETLGWPNAFGNTNRFTAPDGTAYDVSGNRTFIDHFTRLQWYVPNSPLTGPNWTDIIAAAEAHSFAGHSDWHLPGLRVLMTLLNYKQAGVLNYGPILQPSFTWFTGTTVPGTVGSAYGIIVAGGTTGTATAASKAATTNRYGLFVRRWTPPTPP